MYNNCPIKFDGAVILKNNKPRYVLIEYSQLEAKYRLNSLENEVNKGVATLMDLSVYVN